MSIHGVNARQLQIISILKEAKCTNTAELQEELGVSRRTLRMGVDQSVISKNINSGIKRIQRELRAYLEED